MTKRIAAAASRYTRSFATASRGKTNSGAQQAAWEDWRTTPEVQRAASWMGNAMSGARLFAGRRGADGTVEPLPDNHRATDLVASIAGGPDGQAELLREFGVHLVVAGEGWIVITVQEDGEDWHVLSVREISVKNSGLEAEIRGTPVPIPVHDPAAPGDPLAPIALRVWSPSPARYLEAHSPVIGAREQLDELRLLGAAVKAITRSRLHGRGVLLVPKGTRFPDSSGQGDAEDDLIEVFMEVASTAIRDPESAAATIPIILEVPAELIGQIEHLKMESEFDELAIRLREEAIRRFANSVEIPAEILLGQGDMNHWTAWALKEEAVKLGVEPRLSTVTHALTTSWLRPILEDEGEPDAHEVMVWYDTSPLRVRANRAQTALELYDRQAISAPALRRETGFDESDAPASTSMAQAPTTTAPGRPESDTEQETDMITPTRPHLPVDETEAIPETLDAATPPSPPSDGLLAAADALVYTALQQAGEKLKRTPACPRKARGRAHSYPSAELHTILPAPEDQADIPTDYPERWRLLEGAWRRVPEIAARYGADPDCLTTALQSYTRELIVAGVAHDYGHIAAAIGTCGQARAA